MGTVGSLERGGGARPQLVQPGLSKFRDEILDGKKKQATQRPEKAQKTVAAFPLAIQRSG